MRWSALGKILLALLVGTPPVVGADASSDDAPLPYLAYVVVDQATVRSGPGDSHYATEELPVGAEVEVHRRDPGLWMAIRPPADSFSWIPADKLELTDQPDVAEVTAEDAVAWMGSNVQAVQRHRWQVRLEPGERVALLGSEVRDEGGRQRTWYRIAPPAGEFRWIHADDVRTARPTPAAPKSSATAGRTTRSTSSAKSQAKPKAPAPALAARTTDRSTPKTAPSDSTPPPVEPTRTARAAVAPDGGGWVAARRRPADRTTATTATSGAAADDEANSSGLRRATATAATDGDDQAERPLRRAVYQLENVPSDSTAPDEPAEPHAGEILPVAGEQEVPSAGRGEPRVVWAPRSPRREAQQLDRLASLAPASAAPEPPALGAARKEADFERTDIELQLSLMVSRDPSLWNLPSLRGRTEALIEQGQTPLERGQARLLLEQIEEFEDLYERHVQAERGVIVPASTAGGSAASAGRPAPPRLEPRFDGSGWLVPVHSTKRSAPPYAISDDSGRVLMYVAPAPGVNLHRYERKRVGIYGQKSTVPELTGQVLTAHRIIDLERHTTR